MGFFSKNKERTSKETIEIIEELSICRAEIKELRHNILLLETNLRSLRGLVNRKLSPEQEEVREGEEEEKDLNKDDGFNSVRGLKFP